MGLHSAGEREYLSMLERSLAEAKAGNIVIPPTQTKNNQNQQ